MLQIFFLVFKSVLVVIQSLLHVHRLTDLMNVSMHYFRWCMLIQCLALEHQLQRLHPCRQYLIRLLHHQQRNSDDWPQTRRTGLEQLPVTKLQLFCLDWTMNWNVILPKFWQHLMFSVDWVSEQLHRHISTIRLYSAIQVGCCEKDIIVTLYAIAYRRC